MLVFFFPLFCIVRYQLSKILSGDEIDVDRFACLREGVGGPNFQKGETSIKPKKLKTSKPAKPDSQ